MRKDSVGNNYLTRISHQAANDVVGLTEGDVVAADQVVCQSSAGDSHNLLPGLVIRLGERVTGWCAANQKIAMNSDAHLDLIQMATRFTPPLRSTICLPLMNDERMTAVFTGYSTQESPFEDRHRYTAERVAELLNKRLTSATQGGRNVRAFPVVRP